MSSLQSILESLSTTVQQLQQQLHTQNIPINDFHLYEQNPSIIDEPSYLPPSYVFNLLERLRVDARALEAAVTPTRHKLTQLALAQTKASALEAAVELKVANNIAEAGEYGIRLEELAHKCGCNANKLCQSHFRSRRA